MTGSNAFDPRYPIPATVHLELLIPDLVPPYGDAAHGLALPALERLLGRALKQSGDATSLEDWVCRAAGLADNPPVAAISLLGDGGTPGAAGWVRADPVHLRYARDRFVVETGPAATLTHDEAADLVATLNRHFAAEGLRFSAVNPRKWYVQTAAAPDVVLSPLDEAKGRSADAHAPTGPDAMAWQRFANEAQMLFHEHPVNQAREARGEAPINSVWFWGAGTLPATLSHAYTTIWSDDATARGIALLGGAKAAPAPSTASQLLASASGSGRELVVLEALGKAAREEGLEVWRAKLMALDADWFAPLLAALKRDRIGMLSIHAISPQGSLSAETIRGDLMKFWRRTRPLATYAPASSSSPSASSPSSA
jgi:hypothetical protein